MSTILTTRRFALWWRLAREWFESKFSNIKTSTPYITMDGSSIVFNYFTPKQMAEVYMWLEGGLLNFEIRTDEEGQYSLLTKSDIQELDGMFVIGGEEHDLDTIIDTIPVDLKGYKVSEVRIEGIDADLLGADFTWKLAEIGNKLDNIKLPEIDTTELAKQGDNPEATNSKILDEVRSKLTPLEAVLTELDNGKQEMVDAIIAKGGYSSTDKSLSEIASDVRGISNIDKTFNEVDFFMATYGLSKSPLQLINQHYNPEYSTYICYIVDADFELNINRGPYMMFTADGAISDPEGSYIIPEWENRYGYFIFAYKNSEVIWENYNAYFIGMYGATSILDNRTLTNFIGIECDACDIVLGESCFANRTIHFIQLHDSVVEVGGSNCFDSAIINNINLPQIKSAGGLLQNIKNAFTASLPNATRIGQNFLKNSAIQRLYLPSLQSVSTQSLYYATKSVLTELYLPEVKSISGSESIAYLPKLKKVYAPKCVSISDKHLFTTCSLLEDITLGEVSTSFSITDWSPTNIGDATKAAKIDKTIREGIANRVQDRTDSTPLTITLSQEVRNILTEETEAVFAAKNWNISPAKSV